MGRSLGRDIKALERILEYQNKLKGSLEDYDSFKKSDPSYSKMLFDVSSFYLGLIDSDMKLLSDSTLHYLLGYIDVLEIRKAGNIIWHNYYTANTAVLRNLMNIVASDRNVKVIEDRLKYCVGKVKKK